MKKINRRKRQSMKAKAAKIIVAAAKSISACRKYQCQCNIESINRLKAISKENESSAIWQREMKKIKRHQTEKPAKSLFSYRRQLS
jgi:hypothetical protein